MAAKAVKKDPMTLRKAREIAGMSREELAAAAGTSATTIYDLEAGRNRRPAHDLVVYIVRALNKRGMAGITMETLFPVPELSERP